MEYPHLEFELPTSHYVEDEKISVVMLPSLGGEFDVVVKARSNEPSPLASICGNRTNVRPPFMQGEYFLKARWRSNGESSWTRWSPPLHFTVHKSGSNLSALRERDHRLSLMLERGVGGAVTLVDPEAEPPGMSELTSPKWFATPAYEGATPLVNEDPDYYDDPFEYYLDSIDHLALKGAVFLTWHDLLEGLHSRAPLEILLQFDVDGGPRSMQRIYHALAKRGIPASLMVHRRGHYWYPYELEDTDIGWIKEAELQGWSVGYHNNALSQVVGNNLTGFDSHEWLAEATAIFAADVRELRRNFDVRTFTHHGGNIYNLKVAPPNDLEIIGVDRSNAPEVWNSIDTMFSDGGFISRPSTLREKTRALRSGRHFFRNHPFKYGNYSPPVDVPPRFVADFPKVGLTEHQSSNDWLKRELEKEKQWLQQRQESRTTIRLSYLRSEKPISSRFSSDCEVDRRVGRLRQNRSDNFLRLYPWAEGDPRVFWSRMVEAWAPKSGELINVGALPDEQKNDLREFLGSEVMLTDMDIDPSRHPDYLMDICEAPESMNAGYAGVLLFGLSYFASPSETIAACARLTSPGGRGLFGFVADTHPARGSVFHPKTRHLWRREKEPLSDVGLKGNLWAFDQESLSELFEQWDYVDIETMGHYWFVVAGKS